MVNFKLRIWAFTSWNQITTSEVHTTAIRRNKAIGGSRLPVGLWSNTDQVLERKSKMSSRKSQGKMLLTSFPYVEKFLTIFWSKLPKCYWHLVYILEKVWLYFDSNRQNVIDILSIYRNKVDYIFDPNRQNIIDDWQLVNMLAKGRIYFDPYWQNIIDI